MYFHLSELIVDFFLSKSNVCHYCEWMWGFFLFVTQAEM